MNPEHMKLLRITPWFRTVLLAGTAAGLLASCSTLELLHPGGARPA